MRQGRLLAGTAAAICTLLIPAGTASAGEDILGVASYPDATTYQCRTDAIPIYPGQNLNDFNVTKTCPHAVKVSGPGDASVFNTSERGFITRFEPSMVEILPGGKLKTPSVWDLHLHHVVWIDPSGGGPTFAAGEEKTIAKLPQGYGYRVRANADWVINQMIHNLTASQGRSVYITWEIDWVPEASPSGAAMNRSSIKWLDVAGLPQIYPVFDAERGFDLDGDGKFTFPDEVPSDPSLPGYEERSKISASRMWTVPGAPGERITLVFGAGHLHPGGLNVDLQVARDGPDPGGLDGDDPGEVRPLFRSEARYYEPAGAVSWDVSMKATRPEWRISLQSGDLVSINATYDVSKASWYESMGILPLAWSRASDPAARDPFTQAAEVQAMYEAGGILTHGRLPENIDKKAGKNLKLPNPRKLKRKGKAKRGIDIDSFAYSKGGYSAVRGVPTRLMRPPGIRPGGSVTFTNLDAPFGTPQTEQVWHSITSCKAPCNRGSGIGYPLASGPIKFDSGQLGFGENQSAGVTTGTDTYTTPPLTKPGKTYTYFCRIHPFMRGSIRVAGKNKKRR